MPPSADNEAYEDENCAPETRASALMDADGVQVNACALIKFWVSGAVTNVRLGVRLAVLVTIAVLLGVTLGVVLGSSVGDGDEDGVSVRVSVGILVCVGGIVGSGV